MHFPSPDGRPAGAGTRAWRIRPLRSRANPSSVVADVRCCPVGQAPFLWRHWKQKIGSSNKRCITGGARKSARSRLEGKKTVLEVPQGLNHSVRQTFLTHRWLASIPGRVSRGAELSHHTRLLRNGGRKASGTCSPQMLATNSGEEVLQQAAKSD